MGSGSVGCGGREGGTGGADEREHLWSAGTCPSHKCGPWERSLLARPYSCLSFLPEKGREPLEEASSFARLEAE